jgi:putative acetyltransferase
MKIRLFRLEDAGQIAQLFHDTVREVNRQDYSMDQVKAWAPDNLNFRNWAEVCANRFTYVAEDYGTKDYGMKHQDTEKPGAIAGFAELEPNGHIDCFYCHKNYQRCGVGTQLYQAIEAKALELKLDRLFVEASITAKPFFQRMGFSVLKSQQVLRREQSFTNYVMEKWLN